MSALPVVSDTNYLGQSLYSLAAQSDTPACPLYDYIMIELGQVRQHPVAFVIDELNEVFEANKQDDNFFRDFTIMTGYLGGVRNLFLSPAVLSFPVFVGSHDLNLVGLCAFSIRENLAVGHAALASTRSPPKSCHV